VCVRQRKGERRYRLRREERRRGRRTRAGHARRHGHDDDTARRMLVWN
jgi:hypothetical protein